MGTETERRWLLPAFSLFAAGLPRPSRIRRIEQGYLERSDPLQSLRVRIVDGTDAVITSKRGAGMERTEVEEPLTLRAANILMDIADHRLQKVRYNFGPWEVDIFDNPLYGLVLAEFEGERDDVLAARPEPWMGPGVVEVTDSITNLHLARWATDLGTGGNRPLRLPNFEAVRRVRRVVITGGPGSGKSTVLTELRPHYPDAMFVPEVATILISQVGVRPKPGDPVSLAKFQQAVYRTQRIFERTSVEFAALEGKRLVVMDRGTMDNAAYIGVRELERLMNTTARAEYSYYDAVIALDVPPRAVYERIKGNNPARSEDYPAAAALERAIVGAWSGHPKLAIVGNDGGWDGKVADVRRVLDGLLQ